MRERAYRFGSQQHLVGIVTEPDSARARPAAPAVILANVGLNHRVGPHRMYVDLARHLATLGFVVLRFDVSGLGDSDSGRGTRTELQRAVVDMQEALDFMGQRKNIHHFVLMGLCSGVDPVHSVALLDSRVTGVVCIDGYAYRTPGFWLRFATRRNLQRARWKRYAKRVVAQYITRSMRAETGDAPEIYVREYPTPQQLENDLNGLVARGVSIFYLYTGSADTSFNYPNQFFDMLPGLRPSHHVQVELWVHADHLFSSMQQHNRLIKRLGVWVTQLPENAVATRAVAPDTAG